MVSANFGDDTVSVLLGNGDGTLQTHQDYATGSGPHFVTVADVNGDGKSDLIVANLNSNSVSVLLGVGDGKFQSHIDSPAGAEPQSVAVADFDGDGKLDLAVADLKPFAGAVHVLLGAGNGTFRLRIHYGTAGARAIAVADFNRDGKMDLVVANDLPVISVLIGKGDGTFKPHVDYSISGFCQSLVVADFNGDGNPDVAGTGNASFGFGDFTNDVEVLLGNGDGTLQTSVRYSIGTRPESLAVGDFNHDGLPDLAVANWYAETVSVLLNTGGTF